MAHCEAMNQAGGPSGAQALVSSVFCFMHDPARAPDRAEARRRGGFNRRTAPSLPGPLAVCLGDLDSVKAMLERVMLDTLALENSARRSRTVGYLIGIALKLYEAAEVEERLQALEALR